MDPPHGTQQGPCRERCLSPEPLQGQVDEPTTKFPHGEGCPSTEPSSPYPSGSLERIPPNRAPTKGDAPFLEPSNYLLKFPVNGLPRFPNGSLWRETPISRAFFYIFPSKYPVNEPPSMFPNWVPKDRETLSSEPMVYSFICICQSPQ